MLHFPDYTTHPGYAFPSTVPVRAWETLRFLPRLSRSALEHIFAIARDHGARRLKNAAAIPATDRFAQDGFAMFQMQAGDLDTVRRLVRPELEALSARHLATPANVRSFGDSVRLLDRDKHVELYGFIQWIVERHAGEVVKSQLGRAHVAEIRLTHFVADDLRVFTYGEDLATPWRYCAWHVDLGINELKSMIYLGDVTSDGGAFCYLRGSQKWNDSRFDQIVMRAHSFSVRGRMAWTWLNDPLNRARFSRLPRSLQKKHLIGADFQNAWPQLESHADEVVTCSGPAGTCVLFDVHGLHMGGFVTAGERQALAVTIRQH